MKLVYKLHICRIADDEVVKSFYGGSKEMTVRMERNINVNLDHEQFYLSWETVER